jgi:hypothetical protein
MSSVLKLIRDKKINGSNKFWHEHLLRSVGELALTSPRQGIDTLMTKFTSEAEANNYFIDVVVKTYIVTAIHHECKGIRKRLEVEVSRAKELWIKKQNKHCQIELYLGTLPFHDELRRSCEEFYAALRNVWGFKPYQLFYMK